MYATVHKKLALEIQEVGIREFRDNLSSYLLTAEVPVAITGHGDTVGLYITVRRKRTDAEKQASADFYSGTV